MAGFCGMCGAQIDPQTGLCPNCDQKAVETVFEELEMPVLAEPEKPIKNEKANIGPSKLISVLGAICLFLTVFCALAVCCIRGALAEETAKKLLDNITLTDAMSVAGILPDADNRKFINFMEKEFDVKITEKEINKFVDDSTIKDFLAEELGAFFDGYFAGKAEIVITRAKVMGLLQDNRRLVNKTFDTNLSDSDLEKMTNWIMESEEETAQKTLLTSDTIKESYPGVYFVSTVALSYVTMWVFVALSLLAIFLMLRNSLTQGMLVSGVVLTTIGGLGFVAAAGAAWFPGLWAMLVGGSAVGVLIGNILTAVLLPGAVLLAVGVLSLVGRGMILKSRKKLAVL